jgi:glycosyltransferase involved in cell wall biosynthesis
MIKSDCMPLSQIPIGSLCALMKQLKPDNTLFDLWLLALMPAEYKITEVWTDAEEADYRRLASECDAGLKTAVPVSPFMQLVLQREKWIAQKHDLQTMEGLAHACEWIFADAHFSRFAQQPTIRKELLDWANQPSPGDSGDVTLLMKLIWHRRHDLQSTYDLSSPTERNAYCDWFTQRAGIEHNLTGQVLPPAKKSTLQKVKSLIKTFSGTSHDVANPIRSNARVSIVGSFTGEFGVGEHGRGVVRSLDAAGAEFSLVNAKLGPHDHSNQTYENRFTAGGGSVINLVCLNVMSTLGTMREVGADTMLGRYNILYGYWELARCPAEWQPYLDLYDEFWGPTKFITDALSASTSRPVHHMPIAVTVDPVKPLSRAELGLPSDKYLFLFHFDAFSFCKRKNPQAAIQAFRRAFPKDDEPAALVIKTKYLPDEMLSELKALTDGDPRCIFLSGDFPREKIIALEMACDAYISLHRSEGFGFGPAEMMYLGKPVIVTNYSGNTDFTIASNSCLVDYRPIPVEPGDYAYYEPGQVWADPDIEQAAAHMRRLVAEPSCGAEIGKAAAAYMRENHNPQVIGSRYLNRLSGISWQRPR